MAREAVAVQETAISGLEATYTEAVADGHSFVNTGREFVHVKNDNASTLVLTIQTPDVGKDGLAVADRTISIPTTEERFVGPFRNDIYRQDDGSVYLDYDVQTDVNVAVIRLG